MTTNPPREDEPVAWLYESGQVRVAQIERMFEPASRGWTETPLYAHPPAKADDAELVEAMRVLSNNGWLLDEEADICRKVAATIETLAVERDALRGAAIDCAASLNAAISLLERGGKYAKKAAPSDKMFDLMVADYRASLGRARATLNGAPNHDH